MAQCKPHIFISFAECDRDVAIAFRSLLEKGCGVSESQIFSTSTRGSVESAEDFTNRIRDELTGAVASIHLLSPSYFHRPFCRDELGAAWGAKLNRLLVLVPPATHDDLDGTLEGNHVRYINDEEDLDTLASEVTKALGLKEPNARTWNKETRYFLRHWNDLSNHVVRPDDRPLRVWTPATEQDVSFATFAKDARHVFITSGMITRALHDLEGNLSARVRADMSVMVLLPSLAVSMMPFDEDGVLNKIDSRNKRLEIATTLTHLQTLMNQGATIQLKLATFTPTVTVFIADAWEPDARLYLLPLLYRSYDFWRVAASVRRADDAAAFDQLCERFGSLWDDGTQCSADELELMIEELHKGPGPNAAP